MRAEGVAFAQLRIVYFDLDLEAALGELLKEAVVDGHLPASSLPGNDDLRFDGRGNRWAPDLAAVAAQRTARDRDEAASARALARARGGN